MKNTNDNQAESNVTAYNVMELSKLTLIDNPQIDMDRLQHFIVLSLAYHVHLTEALTSLRSDHNAGVIDKLIYMQNMLTHGVPDPCERKGE